MVIDNRFLLLIQVSVLYFIIIFNFFAVIGSRSIWLVLVFVLVFLNHKEIKKTICFILESKQYLAVLVWCIASVAWSRWPGFTLHETFVQILIFCVIALIVTQYDTKDVMRALKLCSILCILSMVLTIPFSSSWVDGSLRGIYDGKNAAGQYLAISTIFLLFDRSNTYYKSVVILLGLSLLVMTKSGTAIVGLSLAFLIVAFIKFTHRLKLGFTFYKVLAFSIFSFLFFALLLYGQEVRDYLISNIDNDLFTGRGMLWVVMLEHLESAYMLGFGYGSVWWHGELNEVYYTDLAIYYTEWISKLAGSDSGYVDIVLNIGFIGLIIFFYFCYKYLLSILSLRLVSDNYYKFLLVYFFIIIISFTESTILVPQFILWFVFLLVYGLSVVEKKKFEAFRFA